ncbi:MAG: TadE/TadG family type IV pilus assembly protein [Fuscovulum sp.]|nr:MAG: TadE/TadG family type IV pilus assembly protein [Fuscovulum sp.]
MALFPHLRRFANDRSGAALVEFALALPLIILVSYISIDGLRLMWSYQAATAGVHEATRYLARVAPGDICETGGTLSSFDAALFTMVDGAGGGQSVFGRDAELLGVTTSLRCVADAGLRQPQVPVVTVSADLRMFLPLHLVLSQLAGTDAAVFTARIEEQARVYGL